MIGMNLRVSAAMRVFAEGGGEPYRVLEVASFS